MKTAHFSIVLTALSFLLLQHLAQGLGDTAQGARSQAHGGSGLLGDDNFTTTTEIPSLRDKKCYPSLYDRKHRSLGFEALPRCSCGHLRWHYPAKTLQSSFYRDMPYRYYVCVKIIFLDAIISWWEVLKTNVQKKLLPPARETYCFASYKGTVNLDFGSTPNVTYFQTLIKYQAPLEVPITTGLKQRDIDDLQKRLDASDVHDIIYASKFGGLPSNSTAKPTDTTAITTPTETEHVTKAAEQTPQPEPTVKRTDPTTRPTEYQTTTPITTNATKPTETSTYPTNKPTENLTYRTTKPIEEATNHTTKPTENPTYHTTKPTEEPTYHTTKPTVKPTYRSTKPTEKRTYPTNKPAEPSTTITTITMDKAMPDYVVITRRGTNGRLISKYYILRHLYEKRHGPLTKLITTTQAPTSHYNSTTAYNHAKQTTAPTEPPKPSKFVYNSREMRSRHRRGVGIVSPNCDCTPIQRQTDCSCGAGAVDHVGGVLNRDDEQEDEEIKGRLTNKKLLTLKALCQTYPYWTDGKTVKPCEEVWGQCKDKNVPRTVRK